MWDTNKLNNVTHKLNHSRSRSHHIIVADSNSNRVARKPDSNCMQQTKIVGYGKIHKIT